MLSPLFAIKIYKESLALDDSIQSAMREYLLNVFDKISTSHCLEKDGGKSTHQLARELHNNEIFQPLCNLIFNSLFFKKFLINTYLKKFFIYFMIYRYQFF